MFLQSAEVRKFNSLSIGCTRNARATEGGGVKQQQQQQHPGLQSLASSVASPISSAASLLSLSSSLLSSHSSIVNWGQASSVGTSSAELLSLVVSILIVVYLDTGTKNLDQSVVSAFGDYRRHSVPIVIYLGLPVLFAIFPFEVSGRSCIGSFSSFSWSNMGSKMNFRRLMVAFRVECILLVLRSRRSCGSFAWLVCQRPAASVQFSRMWL